MRRFFFAAAASRTRLSSWLPWLIIILSLIVLLPIFYIARYNHPSTMDDYENVAWHSLGARQWELYQHWSGRYFTNLASSLTPLRMHSLAGYRCEVVGIMIATALLFTALIFYALKRAADIPSHIAAAVGVATTALLFNNFSSLVQGFYWLTGAVTYMLPTTAILVAMIIFVRLRGEANIPWWTFVSSATLLLIAIGGNEVLMFFCDLLIFANWRYVRTRGMATQRRFYFSLLMVCAVGSAAALFAPGNFARGAMNPNPAPSVILLWLKASFGAFRQWIANPWLWLYSVAVASLLAPFARRISGPRLWQAFFALMLLVLLLLLPATAGLGAPPPGRVLNQVYVFFLLGWLVFLLVLIRSLQELPVLSGYQSFLRQASAIAAFCAFLATIHTQQLRAANSLAVARSLFHDIPQQYDQQSKARYAYMRNTKADTVFLKPLPAQAENPLFLVELPYWASANGRYFAQYYGRKMAFGDTTDRRR